MRIRLAALLPRLWAFRTSRWFRYSLPVLSVFFALCAQFLVALWVGPKSNFPFAFFYLMAAFVTAWVGGFVPGVICCVLIIVGLPLAVGHDFFQTFDWSRLLVFCAVSILISSVARAQRRMRQKLQIANEELDQRVASRTKELAAVVDSLRSEIEQHKRTTDALIESEQRVDFTLDSAGIGRWDLDLATRRMSRSRRHDQIFGYEESSPDWTCETFLNHIPPEDRPIADASFRAALAEGGFFELDTRIVRTDGEVRWVWIQGKVLLNSAGRPVSLLGSIHDITGRKVAEERLHAQLARLNLLDHITRGVGERQDLRSIFQVVVRRLEDNLPVDFGCICLYDAGRSALDVTCIGVRSEELATELAMGENASIPIDANGLSRCVAGQLVYEPDVALIDFPFPRRMAQGGMRSLVAAPLLVANEVFGVVIAARRQPNSFDSGDCEFLRQLSEHVALASHQSQIRTALQDAYDELHKSQQTVMQQERLRALGQMASGIAHDINNAVSPVALYTESLLENEPNLSARTRQYLETTQRAIEDVAETVARMREFYRQQEPQLVLAAVHVGTLVRQVLALTEVRWSDMAQRRGATIQAKTELDDDLPAISGIESEIREALTNLIMNAVDAMPQGGTLTVRAKFVTAHLQTQQVHLEVSDTGIGMDDDTRRRCLEPFFTTKGERGTGLGLAMVYGTAKRHNAEIEIDSEPGKGTTTRLIFPVPEAAIAAPEPVIESRSRQPSLRILVVDDDPLLLKSLRDTLEADGHAVTMANGGNEGIAAFHASRDQEDAFAVVITDLGMPYTDGRKVAGAIKAASPTTPVILLTGWGQRLIAEGDIPPEVDRVLSKPPKLRDLRAALAECAALSPVAQMTGAAR